MTIIFLSVLMAFYFLGCTAGITDVNSSNQGTGSIKITGFDSPPPRDVQHIYLNITEISVHSSEQGWVTLSIAPQTIDFLQLVNGVTKVLADTSLPAGHYQQMRLTLANDNEVVVGGSIFPLRIPSGQETGIKINLDFTVEQDQLVEIFVDFDASRSVDWVPGQDGYVLHPVFKSFFEVISGTVSGVVTDQDGNPIPNALVEAAGPADTYATLTGADGLYFLVLPEGTYNVSASADSFTSANTSYQNLSVVAGQDVPNIDFVLTP